LSEILWYKMFLFSEEVHIGFIVFFVFTDCLKILWYNRFQLSEEMFVSFVVVV
jgi:hypothetical protein